MVGTGLSLVIVVVTFPPCSYCIRNDCSLRWQILLEDSQRVLLPEGTIVLDDPLFRSCHVANKTKQGLSYVLYRQHMPMLLIIL